MEAKKTNTGLYLGGVLLLLVAFVGIFFATKKNAAGSVTKTPAGGTTTTTSVAETKNGVGSLLGSALPFLL